MSDESQESWVNDLDDEMRERLEEQLRRAMEGYGQSDDGTE